MSRDSCLEPAADLGPSINSAMRVAASAVPRRCGQNKGRCGQDSIPACCSKKLFQPRRVETLCTSPKDAADWSLRICEFANLWMCGFVHLVIPQILKSSNPQFLKSSDAKRQTCPRAGSLTPHMTGPPFVVGFHHSLAVDRQTAASRSRSRFRNRTGSTSGHLLRPAVEREHPDAQGFRGISPLRWLRLRLAVWHARCSDSHNSTSFDRGTILRKSSPGRWWPS